MMKVKSMPMAPYCNQGPPISGTIMAYVEMEDEENSVESSNEDEIEEELAGVYPPPPNVLPESLPLENSLPQLLMSQCGVSEEYELADQTSIRLRIISKEMSLQRLSIYMPSLIELDLSGSWLLSLRDLGCGLRIQILKVSRCGLDCLDGLLGLTTLKELHAQSNYIRDIGSCAVLPRLQLLDLSGNRVSDLGFISFLSICTQLRDLNLSDNPVSSYPEYRDVVMEVLPGLNRLDGEMLAVDETTVIDRPDIKEDVDKESHEIPNKERKISEDNKQNQSIPPFPTSPMKNKDISNVKVRERPSTSIGVRQSSNATGRLQRPNTAGPNRRVENVIDEDTLVLTDIDSTEENSASRLTSGRIVCGNLTAALRRRPRQNKKEVEESWCHQPIKNYDSASLSSKVDINKNVTTDSKTDDIDTTRLEADKKRSENVTALLEASRRWRDAYSKFRDSNREKWANESDNSLSEEEEGAEASRNKK